MGAFYNSICVPGSHREKVRRTLERWLSVKGFEPRAGPVLFDLDGDHERSAFLLSSERWTVLFYSHFEEELRLIHELRGELEPLLYVWVYDSDAWGYDLFDADGFAGSYASDPRTHQSFAGQTAAGVRRPKSDADTLCEVLGVSDRHGEVRRIERLRWPFKEDICRELCRVLGVEVAASSYDDLESGALELGEEWRGEQLLFALRDRRPTSSVIDLHGSDLKRLQPSLGYAPSETVSLPPEILAEMKRMRRRLRVTHRLLRPVSWLARTWRRFREATARRTPPAAPVPLPARRHDNVRIESAVLLNDRHRCRITLAAGARPTTVSTKPSSVFAFQVGEVTVTCTARRRSKIDEVLRRPNRSRVLKDENYAVGGLPARHVVFELPPSFVAGSQEPIYLAVYVIQTDKALYVFVHRSRKPLPEAVARTLRATVDSFRLLPEPPGE